MAANLRAGQWGGLLPGVIPLSVELQVSPPTVRAALRQLESEGFLKTRGLGRCRRLADGPPKADRRRPRVMTTLAFLAARGLRVPAHSRLRRAM